MRSDAEKHNRMALRCIDPSKQAGTDLQVAREEGVPDGAVHLGVVHSAVLLREYGEKTKQTTENKKRAKVNVQKVNQGTVEWR